jgi:hypothetical protein
MLASAQTLGAKAKSQAAAAAGSVSTPDSRAARYRTAQAAAPQAAEKRLTDRGSGRKKKTSDHTFAASTYSG